MLWHSPNVFLHEWTSHQTGTWVTYTYDSLHLHLCTHVHNMTLTDTIDTICHRSYSSYCNKYLFDTATSQQRSTCTNWTPTEHTLMKSQYHQRIICIPISLQSTCNTIAIYLLFVNYFNLQSPYTQFAINLLIRNSILLAIYLHDNLQSSCSFVTHFYLQSTCTTICNQLAHLYLDSICKPTYTQFEINLLFCKWILLAFNLHTICNQLAHL